MLTAAGGFEMLVAQAVFAAEHFTGRQLDTAALIPAVSRRLRHELANVSIIGCRAAANPRWARRWPSGWASDLWIWTRKLNAAPGIIFPTSLPRRARLLSAAMRAEVLTEVAKGQQPNHRPAAAGSSKSGQHPRPAPERPGAVGAPPAGTLATGGRPLRRAGGCLKAAGSRAHHRCTRPPPPPFWRITAP